MIEETRHEVDPALVGEHVARHVRQRLAPRDLPPPIEERPRRLANGDEAQVIDAGSQARRTRRSADRRAETAASCAALSTMPCSSANRDRSSSERVGADVRVEVNDSLASFVYEPPQQERLDRRGELGHVINAGESMDLGLVETEIGEPSALNPAVLDGDGTLFVVDQKRYERARPGDAQRSNPRARGRRPRNCSRRSCRRSALGAKPLVGRREVPRRAASGGATRARAAG